MPYYADLYGVPADQEMREIDRVEDELSPLPENIKRIRTLIATLELVLKEDFMQL